MRTGTSYSTTISLQEIWWYGPSNLEDDDTASLSSNSSGYEFLTTSFTPKRPTLNPTIPKGILRRMGPAADRLNIPNAN